MMINKRFLLVMLLVLSLALVTACSSEPAQAPGPEVQDGYTDGMYYAQDDEYASSGWKSAVILKVEKGAVVEANWTAISKDGGLDKKTASINGDYGMVAKGGAQAEWHEQAGLVEDYLIETQDLEALTYDAEGYTDAVSGVSIHVNDFVLLAQKALEAGPQARGPYIDGGYYTEGDAFNNGWKETVKLTVLYGNIVSANWNALPEEGDLDKKTASMEGEYGMVAKGGAQAEWHEQAMAVEARLIESQDPKSVETDSDGYTDAIAGVSIHVNGFFELVQKALQDAK